MLEQRQEEIRPERRDSWLSTHHEKQQGDVIYVLRTAQQHHVTLGMIADQKANIVLGAFLIFITVTQSMLEKDTAFYIPILILSGFFTASALFALMVIAPRFRNRQAKSGPNNLLFFGCFVNMGQEEYIEHLNDHLQNNAQAHELMMKDIYQLGQVLNKKYINLRYSYTCLALGIISSVIGYAVLHVIKINP